MLIVNFKLAFTYTQPYFPNPEDCEQRVLTPYFGFLQIPILCCVIEFTKKILFPVRHLYMNRNTWLNWESNVSSGNEEDITTSTGLESPSDKKLVAEVLADNIEDKIPLKDFTLSSKESDSSVQLPSAPSTGNLASSEATLPSIGNLVSSEASSPSIGNLVPSEATIPNIDNLVPSEATIPSIVI